MLLDAYKGVTCTEKKNIVAKPIFNILVYTFFLLLKISFYCFLNIIRMEKKSNCVPLRRVKSQSTNLRKTLCVSLYVHNIRLIKFKS